MHKYIIHRVALAVPGLIGLTVFMFVVLRVIIPVDAIDIASAATGYVDPQRDAQLRAEFGLTGPLPIQYLRWAGNAARGNFGKSFFTGQSVTHEMLLRIPVSLEIGFGALLITVVLAIPIGMVSAAKQDSLIDYVARGGAILFYAIPGFWLATLTLVFGSILFNWAPSIEYRRVWEDPAANLTHVWLPIALLGLHPVGTMTRLVRTQVLEVMRQDYVRTAKAKGLATKDVYFRHILRNAALPIVTVLGLQIPTILSGTVIFEQIFLIPGVGRYLLDSLLRLDLWVVMATNVFFGFVLVTSNLIVDSSYGFIDPRVRLSR